jgi:hypothetical protein
MCVALERPSLSTLPVKLWPAAVIVQIGAALNELFANLAP